jgi:ethanolamine kinase
LRKDSRRSHDEFTRFRVTATLPTKAQLRNEFNELFAVLEATKSPLVFCHNDLLLGNVVYTEERGSVTFIDYEYSEVNFQGFDIGNHFAEFPGIGDSGIDYSLYPSPEYQRAWIRVYLEEFKQTPVTEAEVEKMYKDANKFALSSHFLWALWSLIQAEHSTIDFDFVA